MEQGVREDQRSTVLVLTSQGVMPGVLDPNCSCGFTREVGKMAFHDSDLITSLGDYDTSDISEIATRILMDPTAAAANGEAGDSDGELPDNETPVDLIQFIDSQDNAEENCMQNYKCHQNCISCGSEHERRITKLSVCHADPFMGIGASGAELNTSTRISTLDMDYYRSYEEQTSPSGEQKLFKAWNPSPKKDDDFLFSTSAITTSGCFEEDSEDLYFPETPSPSSRSGTVTADDSDVDIETITDTPRGADSCGYVTQDSTPVRSPTTPEPLRSLQNGSLLSILAKSSSPSGSSSTSSSASSSPKHISLSTYGVSSKVSLAENLMAGRTSLLGQKRKFSKDRKSVTKVITQPAYTHVLCNSNSVNFHDYALSPAACNHPSTSASPPSTSTETARPTVISKRVYKRKQVPIDASDKEKQHHHNQLERNRRQKLADLFIDLRDEVPTIRGNAKASKVVILNEATSHIRELQRKDKHQEAIIAREMHKIELMRKQLRQSKAQLSRHCGK